MSSIGRPVCDNEFGSMCCSTPACARGDAVRLGRQHVRQGVATLATEKTGTVVPLPILPVLQQTLGAGPCGDLTFIVGAKRRPLTKESFGNEFREACRATGINKSAHGLRKIAAIRCAENEATVPQMNAIFGWTGSRMALHYIEAANRKKWRPTRWIN
jgi:hypothetical protein